MPLLHPSDPRLYMPSEPVDDLALDFEPARAELHILMLKAKHAVGLSAPQIGHMFRFFVYRNVGLSWVINPVVLSKSDKIIASREGCLSWPGRFRVVPRHEKIRCRWMDETGQLIERDVTAFHAKVFQHELDHLDGINIFPKPEDKKP